jgi:hypothetical protein
MDEPRDVIRRLREQAFHISAADLELSPTPSRPRVWGAIMELGFPTGIATLLSFAEGTTSLYFSNGGGAVGVGTHAIVRQMAEEFLDVIEAHLAELNLVDETPMPRIGRVRFYARTYEGTLGAEATEDQLCRDHPLSPVFRAGHAVITAIRESSEA